MVGIVYYFLNSEIIINSDKFFLPMKCVNDVSEIIFLFEKNPNYRCCKKIKMQIKDRLSRLKN